MIILLIFSSLICLGVCYYLVSKKDRSYFNFLTPSLIVFVPGNYFLELIHIDKFGYSGSSLAYFFVYTTYSAYYISITLSYITHKSFKLEKKSLPKINPQSAKFFGWIFLIIGAVLYLPIIYEFKEVLTNPREIYQLTRTGYGTYYFLSTTFTYLAFVIFLFCQKNKIPILVCIFLILLHGSKGQLLNLVFITLFFKIYIHGKLVKLKTAIKFLSVIIGIIFGLFYITLKDTESDSLLTILSEYSDYTRNSLIVIDDAPTQSAGKLIVEDAIYSRLPRILYEEKPKDFGHFFLAKEYIPERFYDDTGTPDFGLVGLPFFDFGYLSFFYLILWGVIIGRLAAFVKNKLHNQNSRWLPGYFLFFCFLAGINLIPIGAGYLLPEHLLLAFIISYLLKINLFPKHEFSWAGSLKK